ncbi:MAG: hypothetical protein ACREX8_04075 [Gammaproteobacteria bacterium]
MTAERRVMVTWLVVLAVGFAGMTTLLPDATIAVWQWVAEVPRFIWGTWWAVTEGLN